MRRTSIELRYKVGKKEGFDKAAKNIFELVKKSERRKPNKPITLIIDIEEHRNSAGGFDDEMYVLQIFFGMEKMLPYVTILAMPLFTVKNTKRQKKYMPKSVDFLLDGFELSGLIKKAFDYQEEFVEWARERNRKISNKNVKKAIKKFDAGDCHFSKILFALRKNDENWMESFEEYLEKTEERTALFQIIFGKIRRNENHES